MSTSVPPRDGGALSGTSNSPSYLADEAALRRAFDAQYDTLLASARTQLADSASQAPRIVEAAFVAAWMQRASIHNADQLNAFLIDETKHGTARALSRRAAAARFGGKGGHESGNTGTHNYVESANATESWAKVDRAIHQTAAGPEAHAAAATAGRHGAAAHMKTVGRGQSWIGFAAIGVVALVAGLVALKYTSHAGEDEATYAAVNVPGLNPLAESSPGQIGSTTLGDGTKMKMGPQTKVFKPDGFPTTVRAVKVDGTAQFDVAPGQALPFRVIVKRVQFIATGTSFTVSSFTSDSAVMILVKEGSVAVKGLKQPTTVAANQAVVIDSGVARPATDDERAEAFGWVDGRAVVTNKPLSVALASMLRWFNLDIKVPDLTLLTRPASFNVALDSSLDAIAQVEKSANLKFGYEGENKLFKDAPPASAAKSSKPAAKPAAKKKK
ncbi:MAG TPA: FecR domain-containing protein [Gemmatimonadaceae bacterium]|jgi:ferric-dicitrate binding protein FerR (iron transport regulator)